MDPINIIVAINLFASMIANASGAKKAMKSKLSNVVERPKTYLQKYPPNVSALVLILIIAGIFNLGTLDNEYKTLYDTERLIGLLLFIIFSWVQIYSYKNLGEYYSQEILIFKGHKLKQNGYYKYIRHPQYLSQMLSDLGAGIALLGYIIIPIVVFVEIPLFILRAKKEEQMLAAHFSEYSDYKKKSGFIIPFIG